MLILIFGTLSLMTINYLGPDLGDKIMNFEGCCKHKMSHDEGFGTFLKII